MRAAPDRGSAAVALLAVAGLVLLLAGALGQAGALLATRAQAQTAADAAALAAAPLTFRALGSAGPPVAAAARLAGANGARLVACRCPVDRSFTPRIVEVVVARTVVVPVLGKVVVRASARAEFVPELAYR